MRVAAVALVLIVAAAVVLAFANTLNYWVLGGLLGGLAALLLSIPVSLALFTLLARRHDARVQSEEDALEHELDLDDEFYNDALVYEAEGYTLTGDEDFLPQPHARALLEQRHQPLAGYLPGPGESSNWYEEDLEEDLFERADPRNYPRQPRHAARSLPSYEDETVSRTAQHPTQNGGSRRQQSTRSLAQHKTAALRKAQHEAQQRSTGPRSRRPTQESRVQPQQPSRTSRHLPPITGAQRQVREQETWADRQQRAWQEWNEERASEHEPFTDQVSRQYQHYPRRPSYPRRPRSLRPAEPLTDEIDGEYEDEQDEQTAYHTRRDPNMLSGDLRNPLVRRAPYLYDDDPLREEFAQQLGNERPITRRSSRYEEFEDEEY